MEEHNIYGEIIKKNIKKILLEYKNMHNLTNFEMAEKCDLSMSEYDKIMYKSHGKHGCSSVTIFKICKNLDVDANLIFKFDK